MRTQVEQIIKEEKLDRKRIFEVSKLQYAAIIQQIEQTFVKNGGNIHWSNMGGGFNPRIPCHCRYIGNHYDWYHLLPRMLPPQEPVYVLLEDRIGYRPKYWLYEMYLPEFIAVIDNTSPGDFYLVSKKYQWLISECHEDVVSFVGEGINLSVFEG